jgi:hypothetical protein
MASSRLGAAVAHAYAMMNFPTIGVIPTGGLAIESPIVSIGAPALIALGVTLLVLLGAVGLTLLIRRRGRAVRLWRVAGTHLAPRFGTPKGGC